MGKKFMVFVALVALIGMIATIVLSAFASGTVN